MRIVPCVNAVFVLKLFSLIHLNCATIKVYEKEVYRVNLEDQGRIISQEKRKCYQKISNNSFTKSEGVCPMTWDGLLCWDNTPVGTLAELPCPSYVDRFSVTDRATKRCLPNGEWYKKNPNDSNRYTNYTTCLAKLDTFSMNQIFIIKTIGIIGNSISLVSLCVATFILFYFKRLRCDRNTIHINLYISFLLRAIVYFPAQFNMNNMPLWACRAFNVITTYTVQAVYTWVFVEALYLHNVIFFAMTNRPISVLVYISLGWLIPILVTGIWIILRILYDNAHCWAEITDPWRRNHWALVIYSTILTLVNVGFFINLIRALFVKVSNQPVQEQNKFKKLAKAIFVLLIVFGLYQVVFIPIDILFVSAPKTTTGVVEMAKLYCEHFISSFQGFLVCVLFCFVNGEVHTEIRQKLGIRRSGGLDKSMDNFSPAPRVSKVMSHNGNRLADTDHADTILLENIDTNHAKNAAV